MIKKLESCKARNCSGSELEDILGNYRRLSASGSAYDLLDSEIAADVMAGERLMAAYMQTSGSFRINSTINALFAIDREQASIASNVPTVQAVPSAADNLKTLKAETYGGMQAQNLTDSVIIASPVLVSPALSSISVSTLGWIGAGGSIAGVSDAAGQYVQNGTVRWEQSMFTAITSGVTTPLGMRFGVLGNSAIGAASGAANTGFKNSYYGDTNSIIWGTLIGASSTAVGYKLGQSVKAQYPVYQSGVAALLQQPNTAGIVRGNITGSVVQTLPGFFNTDIPNKAMP